MSSHLPTVLKEIHTLLEAHAASEIQRASAIHGSINAHAAKAIHAQLMSHEKKIVAAVEALLQCKVVKVTLVLHDEQPMPRLTLKYKKKRFTCDPYQLVPSMGRLLGLANPLSNFPLALIPVVEPAVQDILAPLRADVVNAIAKALADKRVTDPIHAKLDKKRALAKQKQLDYLRAYFQRQKFTKAEVMQVWDEALCTEVMES